MLAGLKLFERKKVTVKQLWNGVLRHSQKLQENNCTEVFFLIKLQGYCKFFYRRLRQQFSMVFGPVKKSSENVYISLKTESKYQIT